MSYRRHVVFYLLMLLWTCAYAEVVTDGSLGAVRNLSGQFEIPQNLGTTVGTNLFHSFQTFTVQADESATFTGSDTLSNVISRVTGGNPSFINGLLRSTIGQANFYFINPAGVSFGEQAQVDVPAAFYVSTANRLHLSDGGQFNASLAAPSNLTMGEPKSFGFLGQSAGVIVIKQSSLSFPYATTVSFSGGSLLIDSGWLENSAGTIQLYSVGNVAEVIDLQQKISRALFGSLVIQNHSMLDVSGDGAGEILLRAGDILLKQSYLAVENYGTLDSPADKGLDILARSMRVDKATIATDVWGSGRAANMNLQISDGALQIINGAVISSDAWDVGNAGNININADHVLIDKQHSSNATGLFNNANPESNGANAGNIVLKTNQLSVVNGGQISNDTWANGHAGTIDIEAKQVLLDGQQNTDFTGIVSNANLDSTGGYAGNITLKAEQLWVVKGGEIGSNTWGSGDGGRITVNATHVLIDEQGTGKFTGLSSSTFAQGRAGDVVIQANNVEVIGQNGGILAKAGINSAGQSGSVLITADTVSLKQGGLISITTEPTLASVLVNGLMPTTLTVNAQHLHLSEGAQLSAAALGNIPASQIHIRGQILTADRATITTEANNADGGAIQIKEETTLLRNSRLTTSVKGQGNGGDIHVENAVLVLDGGFIQANTSGVGSSGGDITVNVTSLLTSHNQLSKGGNQRLNFSTGLNVIQAASPNGVSGNINLTSPQFDISGSISDLDSQAMVLPEVTRRTCTHNASSASELAPSGKGGLPLNPLYGGFIPPVSAYGGLSAQTHAKDDSPLVWPPAIVPCSVPLKNN